MSWRELRVFLKGLPPDSCTARAIQPRDAKDEFWSAPMDRRMGAWLINAARDTTFATIVMNGDPIKVKKLKPPRPIGPDVEDDRPGSTVIRFGGRHGSGAKQLAAVFGRSQAG